MRLAQSVRPVAAALLFGGSINSINPFLKSSSAGATGVAAMSTSSNDPNKAALIFLHGLGDTPLGWSSLQQTLPQMQPRLSQIKYVFPPAPTIPISINGGVSMPGWFDLYDWPIGIGIKDDKEGLVSAVEQMESIVQKLEKDDGIPRNRIVIGGFSQGGAIALLTAYRALDDEDEKKTPLAACVALSAWLTLCSDDANLKWKGKETPLFWAHGTYDDKVLFEQQAFGIQQLKEKAGVATVESSNYPMGHESYPDEIKAMAEFLDSILYGDNDKEL